MTICNSFTANLNQLWDLLTTYFESNFQKIWVDTQKNTKISQRSRRSECDYVLQVQYVYIYMLIFGYHQRITRRAATATFLPGNKDLHHSTEKASKRQLKAAPAFFHWFFQDVNFLKWFLQQFISISSFRVWVLAPSNRVDGFLWFLNHLPSMVWVQISIDFLLIYVGKKKLIIPKGFFVGTHRGLLMVHWMAQGMARARNTFCTSPKSFSSWPEFREIKDSTFKHFSICLELPTFAPNAFATAMVVFPCLANLWRITKGMVSACSCQNSISSLVDWDYPKKCFTVLCFS